MTDYQQQALDFLKRTGTTISFRKKGYGYYFEDDKEKRHIWYVTLTRGAREWTITFGQSIASGNKRPTAYDVLACVEKYDVGTFDNFCSEFGYNDRPLSDYPKILKIYNAVVDEYNNLKQLFNEEEMELLREIN